MDARTAFAHVDHTLLKPCAVFADFVRLADEAIRYGAASVCVPPAVVRPLRDKYPTLNICTVIGFPLGYATQEDKVFETLQAIGDGATEIDMVINLGWVKERRYDLVSAEIAAVRRAARHLVLKVIVETCYLDEEEKVELCHIVAENGADYIKTSTGFGSGGASLADINLFKRELAGTSVKIKASGGIRETKDFYAYLDAGCDRIGASAAVSALIEAE